MNQEQHKSFIQQQILTSIEVKKKLAASDEILQNVSQVVDLMVSCFKKDGKVLLCGNGGSAADAQHLAAELSGRFRKDRPPLFAEALHVNSSFVTAVANDYSYDEVFARMVRAMGRPGDVLLAFSTSGNSTNVLRAVTEAKNLKITCIGLTGGTGGNLGDLCDIELRMPSDDTARIQEGHMIIGHTICELVEKILFPE